MRAVVSTSSSVMSATETAVLRYWQCGGNRMSLCALSRLESMESMAEYLSTEHGSRGKCPAQSSVVGLQMSELLLPPPQLLPAPPQLFNRIMVIIYWMMRCNVREMAVILCPMKAMASSVMLFLAWKIRGLC